MAQFRKIMVARAMNAMHIKKDELDMFRVLATDQYTMLFHVNGSIIVYPASPGDYPKMKTTLENKFPRLFHEQEVPPAHLANTQARETIQAHEFWDQHMEDAF